LKETLRESGETVEELRGKIEGLEKELEGSQEGSEVLRTEKGRLRKSGKVVEGR